ncbi:hypothetical protein [Amnibacterium kyonggiense]|uniref:Uncharacterized protein n=1 Tax=Amnibacterium kyonggiense TaxID=595671 RepID=A0A4R7FKM0_9MICO|nr:hypothetical protein [Amnibacterium kyonggiense]TDS76910.1 hypothetical protein CLV52_1849 [Amnibacterium kyonggiense]
MKGAERALALLALVVPRPRRARFVEEWRSDLAAARSFGVPPEAVLLAACRTALLLLRLRIRDALLRSSRGGELLAAGVLVGLLLAVADVPSAVLVPVLAVAVAVRGRRAAAGRLATARIDGAS